MNYIVLGPSTAGQAARPEGLHPVAWALDTVPLAGHAQRGAAAALSASGRHFRVAIPRGL